MIDFDELKTRLDAEAAQRNRSGELCLERPDPLWVARRGRDEHFALTCALFAYGNASLIVRFLESIDCTLYRQDDARLIRSLEGKYYRFQTTEDIVQWYRTLKRLEEAGGAQKLFQEGYRMGGTIDGLNALIGALRSFNPYRSHGYDFLIGNPITHVAKAPAMKRWMMYLRWMVRQDELDMGLWEGIERSDLIMPLDTHTFAVSRRLGLLQRKSCDLKAAFELTETLKRFDPEDPVKYDFALYRLGQENLG